MDKEKNVRIPEDKPVFNNHVNKDIKADNYKKSKVFDIKSQNLSVGLSRVDSQNDPDGAENLDFIANKMGLNQMNNNKVESPDDGPVPPDPSPEKLSSKPNESINHNVENVPKIISEHHKKGNLMAKILRRLSKPGIFSKDKKQSKTKPKSSPDSTRPSLSSDNKSNTVGENINHLTPRSTSFRKIFSRFGKGKSKNHILSDPPSSIESRPSVSSAINPMTNVDGLGSCNDVNMDKLCRETLEKYNSPSVDCILDHRAGRFLKKEESISSNSEDLRDHERKMNSPNRHIVSIFTDDVVAADDHRPQGQETTTKTDEDKLSPLNIASYSVDNDRFCHSAMAGHTSDTSSNVKLTLSLHGYSAYGLSSSKFSSKSCMEFRSACISPKLKSSMDNLIIFGDKLECKELEDVVNDNAIIVSNNVCENEDEEMCATENVVNTSTNYSDINGDKADESKETDVVLRKSERPNEIQLRRSKVASQTSMARSSLIIVAVAHNTPRSKGVSNHVGTPIYNQESPSCSPKRMDFEEESKPIEEENTTKSASDKDGNDFLIIANKYEEEVNKKIEIVQRYLDLRIEMDDDVIGELNTAIGLAKLLLSEKFVQFRGLCDQNLNEPAENEFKTLACDLEGYLTTLEIQMADLDKNFRMVEKIRENDWKLPLISSNNSCPNSTKKKPVKVKTPAKTSLADTKRAQEARKRLAEYKKISVAASQGNTNLFVVQ